MVKNKKFLSILNVLAILIGYTLITLIIFSHRVGYISEAYGMSGVDTDGTLWYYWAKILTTQNKIEFEKIDLIAFPIGYNVDYIPFNNLLYGLIISLLDINDWYKNINFIILISNIFSLVNYPLHAFCTYLLIKYLTKNNLASAIGGLVAGFSYYFILMGRGALSTNHIYWIPLCLLFVYKSLRERSIFNIIISSFLFSIMFGINAYWAFFTGIFIVAICLFEINFQNKLTTTQKIIFLTKYSLSFLFFLLLLNFQFFSSSFNTYSKIKETRIITPQSELISIVEYLNPSGHNLIYPFGNGGGWFLGYISIGIGLIGLLTIKKNSDFKIYLFSLFCLLLGIVLSSKIDGLQWINDIYFKFFGMFRAVSRLNIFVSLFLSIMVGFTIKSIVENKLFDKIFYKFILFVFLLLVSIGIIAEGLNNDPTWKELTFVTPIKEAYKVVRDNKEINVIAQYPMSLSNGKDGFPPNYQIIGQIFHQKKLVAGADPFNLESIKYYNSVKNIEIPETIEILKQSGVNAVIINSKFLKNGKDIIEKLKKDERLVYVGNYQGDFRNFNNKNYKTTRYNEASADIDLFIIK